MLLHEMVKTWEGALPPQPICTREEATCLFFNTVKEVNWRHKSVIF